ncbi:sugar 3,4-ketoisomerase [Rhodohalobacter sp. 614A]|uniref:sugar 3,4-ketoisomerase n=1 Tax=Rhodohalobacter sp. 614A TaxID=2908649 RepID=UPI001F16674C|nr:FdtA/QdtA family cupin domain-containing protein [Rhodohalobacter sp. 614A]
MNNEVKCIELPKIGDHRGNLTYFEDNNQIPFKIERVFWTYDVPGGQIRGGHAYYKQNEFIIALSGSFDVVITKQDNTREVYSMNRSYYGLFVPAKTWRHLENFSTNSLSLHASDSIFEEEDYIRDFNIYANL